MDQYVGSKLIIVEGLTGSGKSTTAHFVARQLQRNGISARWVHEAEVPHPILIDLESSVARYQAEIRVNWVAFVEQIESDAEVCVVEACFFNNLLEALLAHNVARAQILEFADVLQAIIKPLDPTLVYLVQDDVKDALERNFERRGPGFRDYVIQLSTSDPLALANGWEGYAGMLRYWQEFVALTDDVFKRFPFRKLKINNTAGDWESYDQQVVDFLGIRYVPEETIPESEALGLIGRYRDEQNGREFSVRSEAGELTIDLSMSASGRRLIRSEQNVFVAAGWPFEITIDCGDSENPGVMKFGGRDVEYLPLLGTVAEKAPA